MSCRCAQFVRNTEQKTISADQKWSSFGEENLNLNTKYGNRKFVVQSRVTSMVEFFNGVQHYVSMSYALLNAVVRFMTFASFHLHCRFSPFFFRFAQIFYVIHGVPLSMPIWAHFIQINYHSEYV